VADLIKVLPRSGSDGILKIDGEIWCTIPALSRMLKIARTTLRGRSGTCRKIEGKTPDGNLHFFFSFVDMQKACGDIETTTAGSMSRAGKNGTFNEDGERWATIKKCAHLLGLDHKSVAPRVENCRSRKGRTQGGVVCTFYAFSDVKNACRDIRRRRKRK
jgi:hypothetical protein